MGIRGAEDVAVAVAGGGPVGSILAALIARPGHKTIILEKEGFPHYQIGESSLIGECPLAGTQVQFGGTLGDAAEPAKPLFDNGLLASPDGMRWSFPAS